MAISDYQNSQSQTPLQKVQTTFNPIGAMTDAVDGIFGSLSNLLTSSGLSSGTVQNASLRQVDGIISNGDPNYLAAQGTVTNRVSETAMNDLRAGSDPDRVSGKKYSVEVSPQGVIPKTTYKANNVEVYPPDLGKYYIQFDFMKYERPAPFANTTVETEWSCALPVPSGLTEYYDVNWEPMQLGLVGDIADALTRTGNGGAGLAVTEGAKSAGLRAADRFDSAAGAVLTQALGVAPNPNVSVIFRGPGLRQFNFVWTFAPKDPNESFIIKELVKNIKKRMLPRTQQGASALLQYPYMIQPRLQIGNEGELYQFKKCVIPRFHVSYSPTGIPSFFKGTNLPTFVQMVISLVEIEYFYDITEEDLVSLADQVKPSDKNSEQ